MVGSRLSTKLTPHAAISAASSSWRSSKLSPSGCPPHASIRSGKVSPEKEVTRRPGDQILEVAPDSQGPDVVFDFSKLTKSVHARNHVRVVIG